MSVAAPRSICRTNAGTGLWISVVSAVGRQYSVAPAVMTSARRVELASLLTAQRPGLPVIIMSGYTEDTLDVPGLKEPIALLQKPFLPRELRRRIREVLDR